MKNIVYRIGLPFLLIGAVACQDLEIVNMDPNNPAKVPSNMLMAGAEKKIMDRVYDNWFSGRQSLAYSQFWSQRNYTEEDRYQIRESVNNNYFNYLYQGVANLQEVIDLNTNEATAAEMSAYGKNENQIAAAKILKVWLFQLMTDTWGSIPYTEASKLAQDIYYPKYDDQKSIYAALITELTEAVALIDESQPAFVTGDRIYGGDVSKWKKDRKSVV